MTLADLIAAHVNGDDDLDEATQVIFEKLLQNPEELAAVCIPILRHEIHRLLRIMTRKAEDQSILNSPQADPTADRLAFLAERFYIPKIGFVTWADATIEHHRLRIEYLQVKLTGIEETAQRHNKAITEIKAAGVSTLGEIYAKPKRARRSA